QVILVSLQDMRRRGGHGVPPYDIEITVTDFGSSLMVNFPPCTFTDAGFGVTAFGASNVLTLSTFGALSVSPDADFTLRPAMLASISTALFGSTLVSSNQSLPD